MKKNYITLKGGLTCRAVNPYSEKYKYAPSSPYNEFEGNNPTLDISTSTPMKEGVVFEGINQMQYNVNDGDGWISDKTPEDYLKIAGWDDYKLNGKSFKQIALDAIALAPPTPPNK